MDDSIETKPAVSAVESGADSGPQPVSESGDNPKAGVEAVESTTGAVEADDIPVPNTDKTEDKMDAESTAVDSSDDKPDVKTVESEPSVAAIDESVDDMKGVEPAVEPVPELSVKSPSEVSSLNAVSSPAPAVHSSTPPRSQSKKPKVDLTTVPVRQYLDTTVVPILLQGLSSLARERPNKPINYLANFLLEKANEYDE